MIYSSDDKTELLVLISLIRRRTMEGFASTSLSKLLTTGGWQQGRGNSRTIAKLKQALVSLYEQKMIIPDCNILDAQINDCIDFALQPSLDCQSNFTMLSYDEIDRITTLPRKVNKGKVLAVFLFVKSHMGHERNSDNIMAFWRSTRAISNQLCLSRQSVCLYLDLLVEYGLLVRHCSGVRKMGNPLLWSPNIYVLNDGKQKINIKKALNIMQKYGTTQALPIQKG